MSTDTKFYDIYDYIYTPFWKTTWFLLLILALIAGAIILGAVLHLRYKKNVFIKKITPWEYALEKLEALTPQSYEKKEEFKHFYFSITQIIKKYLQERFAIDVIEKTDEELIEYLKNKMLDPTIIAKLETVLQGSLLIKFANAQALREQAQTDLATVIAIVQETTPKEPSDS